MSILDSVYTFRVKEVVAVIDGDTFDLVLDVGFHQTHASRFRLLGWDTPERRKGSKYERAMGKEATEYALEWLDRMMDLGGVNAVTEKDPDSFGRWLAALYCRESGVELGADLAEQGLATKWPTRWRDVFDSDGEASD